MKFLSLIYMFIAFQVLSLSCANASALPAKPTTWAKGGRASLTPIEGRSSHGIVASVFFPNPLPVGGSSSGSNGVSRMASARFSDASSKAGTPSSCFSPKAGSATGTPDEIVPVGRTVAPQPTVARAPAALTFGAAGSSADELPGTTGEKMRGETQPARGSLARLPSTRAIANPPSLPHSPAHGSRKSSVCSQESWGVNSHRHRRASSIKALHELFGHKKNGSSIPSQLLTLAEMANPNKTFLASALTNNIKRMKQLKGFANFNATDGNGNTALHNAVTDTAQLDKKAVIAFLLAQTEVNVNLQNDRRRTVLHEVCQTLDEDTFDQLLKSEELDLTIKDFENLEAPAFRYTPRHYLKQKSELNGEPAKQQKAKRMLKRLDRYFIRQIETVEPLKDSGKKYARLFKKMHDYETAEGIDRDGLTEDSPYGCCCCG